MKDKKGFVFIETLIVIAVLTVSLLMTYSAYSSTVVKENIRIRYNDSAYMYRTYYLSQFLRDFRLDLVVDNLSKTDVDTNSDGFVEKQMNLLAAFWCTADIFENRNADQGFCESLFSKLNVSNAYITYNDLSFLQDCNNTKGKCYVLTQVREEMANYLKTIGGKNTSGYRIIIEYSEQQNGESCIDADTGSVSERKKRKCKYYYTTLSLGDIYGKTE